MQFQLPEPLRFTPNKGCTYPLTLLSLILLQLFVCLSVIIHLAIQWADLLPLDPTSSQKLLPFFVSAAQLLFVVNTILLYLHYKGRLTPDYAALICLLLSTGFHCACIYIGFRPASEEKKEEALGGFFDVVDGGVMCFGLALNLAVTTLWFVGRRIREENYRKSLMVQRASAAAGLNGHPGMMLSPTDMAALKDIDVDSPISPVDHDLEKNLGGAGGSALTTTVITTTVTAGRGF